jgi:HSP20 family molecular chaperone IbpA
VSPFQLHLSQWVPIKNYSLTEDIGIQTPKNLGKFPIQPEEYYPGVDEEIQLSPEDEADLIQRIGVKSGIHLQALSRDLNRLTQLVEGSLLRPYRRESILCLVDILDELDKMDEQIKQVLINLTCDLKERGNLLRGMLKEEEEDQAREAEALSKSRVAHEVTERILKPKKTGEKPPEPKEAQLASPKPTQPKTTEPVMVQPLVLKLEQPREVTQPTEVAQPSQGTVMPDQTKWKSMKFHPFFDVQDNPDAILMTSYIPGMKKDDLHLDVGTDNFKIEGFRCPSPGEEKELQNEAEEIRKSKQEQLPKGNLSDLILMTGAGKFGSFEENYKLPSNVDRNQIKATYENDFLQIQCPKQSRTEAAF